MGSLVPSLGHIPEICLTNEVLPVAKLLTGCKFKIGTLTEIRRLYEKFNAKYKGTIGHFISSYQFKVLCKGSPLDCLDHQIFKLFVKRTAEHLNFYELLGALVLFASTTWEYKVHFAVCLFDFDGNMCLSDDEFTIFIAACLNGLGCCTATTMPKTADLSRISTIVFNSADRQPDGLITLEE